MSLKIGSTLQYEGSSWIIKAIQYNKETGLTHYTLNSSQFQYTYKTVCREVLLLNQAKDLCRSLSQVSRIEENNKPDLTTWEKLIDNTRYIKIGNLHTKACDRWRRRKLILDNTGEPYNINY